MVTFVLPKLQKLKSSCFQPKQPQCHPKQPECVTIKSSARRLLALLITVLSLMANQSVKNDFGSFPPMTCVSESHWLFTPMKDFPPIHLK